MTLNAMKDVTPPLYTTRQLSRYRYYATLYAEREYPDAPHYNYVSRPSHILGLAQELRVLIYTAALTLPFSIGIWPETDNRIAPHQFTNMKRNMRYPKMRIQRRGVSLSLLGFVNRSDTKQQDDSIRERSRGSVVRMGGRSLTLSCPPPGCLVATHPLYHTTTAFPVYAS